MEVEIFSQIFQLFFEFQIFCVYVMFISLHVNVIAGKNFLTSSVLAIFF